MEITQPTIESINAGLLAAAILALADPAIERALTAWRARQTEAVAEVRAGTATFDGVPYADLPDFWLRAHVSRPVAGSRTLMPAGVGSNSWPAIVSPGPANARPISSTRSRPCRRMPATRACGT